MNGKELDLKLRIKCNELATGTFQFLQEEIILCILVEGADVVLKYIIEQQKAEREILK